MPGLCEFCGGTGQRTWWTGRDASHKKECEYCKCYSEGAPCPYAEWHGPEEVVVVGETMWGSFLDERDGKVKNMSRSTERRIRYADWDARCRICYPRM